MNVQFGRWTLSQCILKAAEFAILLPMLSLTIGQAQTTTPAAQLQYSILTGSGNTISASRVPVINAAGIVLYRDITLQFDVDVDGNLSITTGFPLIMSSPDFQLSTFKPGKYLGPKTAANAKGSILVNGPGIASGGTTAWVSSIASDGDVCTYPSSVTWYVASITNSPIAARLKKAGITSNAWSYGIMGSQLSSSCISGGSTYNANYWQNGSLVGVSQIGDMLTFASFSSFGNDSVTPLDQITYALSPPQQ